MNRYWIAGICVTAVAGWISTAAAGQLVVLESNVTGLNSGDILDGARPLKVPEGKALTVISESGETLRLEGPYSGVPEAGGEGGGGLVAALSDLIQSEGADSSSLGAIRASAADNVKDPWLVDITRDGDHCVRAGADALMWRRAPELFQSIRVSDGKKAAKAGWPEQSATLPWPPPIARVDGAKYKITLDGAQELYIVLHLVPEFIEGNPRRAAWMAERGCRQQALLLLLAAGPL